MSALASARPEDQPIELPKRVLAPGVVPVARLGLAGSYGIDAAAVERAFHELSINYFFVTPRMKGLTEGIRNLIRAGHRERIAIAGGASIPIGASVPHEWEHLSKALGTDYIDVFHLFWVQARWYVAGRTWPAFQRLKAEGKAKALAISCHDRPMARAMVDELGLDVLMIRYNAAHRGAEREIFATLEERRLAPDTASGAGLTGSAGSALPAGSARPGIVAYTATRWGKLLKPVRDLGPMTASECYRFSLQHPRVGVVLSGAASYDELEENARGVLSGPLAEDRLEEIRRFGDAVRATATGKIGFLGM